MTTPVVYCGLNQRALIAAHPLLRFPVVHVQHSRMSGTNKKKYKATFRNKNKIGTSEGKKYKIDALERTELSLSLDFIILNDKYYVILFPFLT